MRTRWEALRPDRIKKPWSDDEDAHILSFENYKGHKWAACSKTVSVEPSIVKNTHGIVKLTSSPIQLPGRTALECGNRFTVINRRRKNAEKRKAPEAPSTSTAESSKRQKPTGTPLPVPAEGMTATIIYPEGTFTGTISNVRTSTGEGYTHLFDVHFENGEIDFDVGYPDDDVTLT